MPRITAPSNAAQRERTQRAILDAFGELLYSNGLSRRRPRTLAATAVSFISQKLPRSLWSAQCC